MTQRPMKAGRSRRPPGFAEATLPPAPPTAQPPAGEEARPAGEASDAPAEEAGGETARDPYAGAGMRQFNTRVLEPLHSRYVQLVRELEDQGYRTSMTEVLQALLDAGPTTAGEARELVRAWRRKREP